MTAIDPTPSVGQDAVPVPSRRGLLVAAAGLAAVSGAGLAWWHAQDPVAISPSVAEPVDGFWSMQWDSPHGGLVKMRKFHGKPLLLNFWATWCPPCVDELPMINAFYRQNHGNGTQVLALAVDKPAAVQTFLQRMPLDFPIGIAALAGSELARSLGNLGGGLPFSIFLGGDGAVVQRKIGRLLQADLDGWAQVK
jgi:thiol-disulfide isomerase/thioredoxin